MKKRDYYIGLDIGTESVGWALTDTDYVPQKVNGKRLMGVRLFESSQTAAERRVFRASRRRNDRKKQRINWLQDLFSEEISKVDIAFYQRLKDSMYWIDDKDVFQPNTLFNDEGYSDKSYHEKYPTIYHLRKELIDNPQKHDVRLVYLALHHMMKNRGHFLFASLGESSEIPFKEVWNGLNSYLTREYEIEFEANDIEQIANTIASRDISRSDKEKTLIEITGTDKKTDQQKAVILKAIAGLKTNLYALFADDELKDAEVKAFDATEDYESKEEELRIVLGDRIELIEQIKAIYDWGVMANILKGEQYLSHAKVNIYDEHKKDLKLLKILVKEHNKDKYKEIFTESVKGLKNYPAYIGMSMKNDNKKVIEERCSQEDFCKYLEGILGKIEDDKEEQQKIIKKIKERTLLPKQVSKDNSVIPYQVHLHELRKILDNAVLYLPFLESKDEYGISVRDKIESIFTFRIPYYVGPLNNKSEKAWLVRTNEKIYPWNFEQVVDIDKSAEGFIKNLTNKCTYLVGEDVIPKNSLLYSEFMLLNEINNLKINGEAIQLEIKQAIVEDLFKTQKKVSRKKLTDYLKVNWQLGKDDTITGIDDQIKSSLLSYHDFKQIISKYNDINMVEEIISWILIFGEDRKLLQKRIRDSYGEILSEDDIRYVSKLKYSGWGRLSRELLTEIHHVDKSTGEMINIINMMRNSTNNLMELLSSKFDYADNIVAYNEKEIKEQTIKEMIDDLYVSPAVKRPITQAITIVNELIKTQKYPPKKIFVEVIREKQVSKRTVSRKKALEELYNKLKTEERELYNQFKDEDERSFQRNRLYLYYTQMGKCMYSGEKIEISQLYNENLYDLDHIYPRSKVKDDSLDNLVLVTRSSNAAKGDDYPIKASIRKHMHGLWDSLKEKNLISKKKFKRLTRGEDFSDEELEGFIARQIIETSQSTKAVAEILGKIYPESDIVYVKAGNVSDFRHKFEFIKVREVNDYHHARDAYLNIVVGNVYDTKYTRNKKNFIKDLRTRKVSMNKMFDYDTVGAWTSGDDGTIQTVEKAMKSNAILFTRYSRVKKGGFYDQNIMKKGSGQIAIKTSDTRLEESTRYGKYNKSSVSYFAMIEHTIKGKRVRSIESIELYKAKEYEKDPVAYCIDDLGLIEPEILIPKIKIDTLFSYNGFLMHLSGKSLSTIVFKPAIQLIIGKEQEEYIKKLVKYRDKCALAKKELVLTEYDSITREENDALYKLLLNKLEKTIYNVKFKNASEIIRQGKEEYLKLSELEQAKIILEIIKMMGTTAGLGDYSLLCDGKNKNIGLIRINKNINNMDNDEKLLIITQSPTGIFEQEIDLLAEKVVPRPRRK